MLAALLSCCVVLILVRERKILIGVKQELLDDEPEEEFIEDGSTSVAEAVYRESNGELGVWVDMRNPKSRVLENLFFEMVMDLLEREKIVERRDSFLAPLTVRLTERGREMCRSRLNPSVNIHSEANGDNSRVDSTYNIGNTSSLVNSPKETSGNANMADSNISQKGQQKSSDILESLAKSLRADVENVDGFERDVALAHADEADRLAVTPDEGKVGKFLGQISGFVDFASSGFSLTKEVLQSWT